jgi:methyl-accepting chemotaxis protein
MKSGWTVGRKLITGFLTMAAITLALGAVGYYGVTQCKDGVDEVGIVRLPSISGLKTMSIAQAAIDSAENALLCRTLTRAERDDKYKVFAAHWKEAEEGWKVYEPLPQTDEEAVTWKDFVPAWGAWKKDHEAYVAMSHGYDELVEPLLTANTLYDKMTQQALVQNYKTFAPAQTALEELQKAAAENEATRAVGPQLQAIAKLHITLDSAENALLCRRVSAADRIAKHKEVAETWPEIDAAWQACARALDGGPAQAAWNKFSVAFEAWKKDHTTYMKLCEDYAKYVPQEQAANELYEKMTRQALVTNAVTYGKADALLEKLVQINEQVGADTVTQVRGKAGFLKTVSLAGLIAGAALAVTLGVLITNSINRALKRIIQGLGVGAAQVNEAASQVSQTSQTLASAASQQASALEETSAALQEMASMTRSNAGHSQEASSLASKAREYAARSDETMQQLNTAMNGIDESSAKISKIIKVIEEIAFQTNLLALNAAVEAARAGEHGKGFAVVAEEVRNLAQRAAEAARETTGLIEESVQRAKEGKVVAGSAVEALQAIGGDVAQVADLLQGITKASEDQAQGVDQINTAVAQMDKVTQTNAAGAEESASASEELSAQAQTVRSMVAQLVQMVGGQSASVGPNAPSAPARSKATGTQRAPAHAAAVSFPADTPSADDF